MLDIEFLYFEGCPHWISTFQQLELVVDQMAPGTPIRKTLIDSNDKARAEGFLGSPSVRVNGRDMEGVLKGSSPGLSCRIYGSDQVPPQWMMEAGILRALKPKNILFVCVANAARSQMAEGLARSMAPADVNVYSAGSMPWGVHPGSTRAMEEIGIDISGHESKSFDAVPLDQMDTLITLCAEEACPWVPTRGPQLHWPINDPGGVLGDEEEELRAFRRARDELKHRLSLVFLK